MVYLQLATKNHMVALSLLPPRWDGEENQKEKAKPVSWYKNSLKEREREMKITTRVQCSHCLILSLLLSSKSPGFSQLPI